jgi:Mor family transcriptional regulator
VADAADVDAILAPLRALLPSDYPEQMRDVADVLFLQMLEDAAVLGDAPPAVVAAVAARQVDRLSLKMGGGPIYIPSGVSTWRLTPRNRQMCEEFRGDYRLLARKWGLSVQQVRNIVDTWMREQNRLRQSDMFPGDDA